MTFCIFHLLTFFKKVSARNSSEARTVHSGTAHWNYMHATGISRTGFKKKSPAFRTQMEFLARANAGMREGGKYLSELPLQTVEVYPGKKRISAIMKIRHFYLVQLQPYSY